MIIRSNGSDNVSANIIVIKASLALEAYLVEIHTSTHLSLSLISFIPSKRINVVFFHSSFIWRTQCARIWRDYDNYGPLFNKITYKIGCQRCACLFFSSFFSVSSLFFFVLCAKKASVQIFDLNFKLWITDHILYISRKNRLFQIGNEGNKTKKEKKNLKPCMCGPLIYGIAIWQIQTVYHRCFVIKMAFLRDLLGSNIVCVWVFICVTLG